MVNYVSLACDEKPTYAWLLPIAAKLWETLGYTPIVQHTLDETNPFEAAVLAYTPGLKIQIAPRPPLSAANTMRAARLYAWPHVADGTDFILTSDVDIFPLERSFFQNLPPHVVLRAAWYLWLGRAGAEPIITPDTFEWAVPLRVRFPMCYVGLPKHTWRRLFPRTAEEAERFGTASLLRAPPQTCCWPAYDDSSWDESALTGRLLLSEAGRPLEALARGRWKKGNLLLIDPLDRPNLSVFADMPRGLLALGDGWKPDAGPKPEGAIDFIPPRMAKDDHSLWVFDLLKLWYPELSTWLDDYLRDAEPKLSEARW